MVWMGDEIGKLVEKAKAAQNGGQLSEAAKLWMEAAQKMQLFSINAPSESSRQRRMAKAREYAAIAGQLKKGGAHEDKKSAPVTAVKETDSYSAEPDNEYRRMVRGLRMKSSVTWEDIGGLEAVQRELESFFGIFLANKPEGVHLDSFRNIMFYGPPGTGKTMIAAAISNQLEAAFFNVKASDLVSKYFGESSKLVNALYEEARSAADTGLSVVFIDEFDSLCRSRDTSTSGAEQRILSTLLSELDGLAEKGEDKGVLTIAATNRPDSLDQAIQSRFQKQFYIPLPDKKAREEIIKKILHKNGLSFSDDIAWLAEKAEGFSGRHLQGVIRGAVSRMISELNPDIHQLVRKGKDAIQGYTLQVGALKQKDLEAEILEVRIDPEEIKRTKAFYEKYRR